MSFTINPSDAGDPENGCNAKGNNPATLTVNVSNAVTVSPASRVYSGCIAQSFSFSSNTAGSYPVTVSVADSGSGTYDVRNAAFTLTVTQPVVTNTAPTVTLTGVVNGASYEYGNVPLGTCNIVDKEDGNSSFDATLSAITGTRAADGLGAQTQSCSYTDVQAGGGKTGTASVTYSIVDTTAPVVSVTAPAPVEATGQTTPVTFAASAYDAVDGNRPVICKTSGDATYASGDAFPIGSTVLGCTSTDKAGNISTSSPLTVTVTDTTAPVVTAPANKTVGNDSPTGATVTYTGASASDLVDGALPASCAPASGSVFPLGDTTVTCSATDAHHNTGSATFTVTVQDQTKPLVTVPKDQTVEATSADGAVATWDAVTATDDVSGSLTPSCSASSGDTFPLGPTTVTCTAKDKAGNTGENSFTVTVVDTHGPVLNLPSLKPVEATSALGATVSYTATALDAVDGVVTLTCSPDSGSQFALGTTPVQCHAEDSRHNASNGSFSITVQDTTAPNVADVDNLVLEATGASGAEGQFTAPAATDIVDGDSTSVCDPATGSVFPLGSTTVTCSATDAAGNTGTSTFKVLVQDTTAPKVAAPANVTAPYTTTVPSVGALVSYDEATASDLVDGVVTPSCKPASGSFFALGATTVTCTATDRAGNSASADFTVTVQDEKEPVVSVPADITAEATSASGAVASWTGVSALDEVDGNRPFTCDHASGDTFKLGSTTVTCTAKDLAGNTGSNHFDVVVMDTTAPTVKVPANVTAAATSALGAAVTYSAPTAFDLVDGSVPAACDKASGSSFPLGTTTVTCSATDSSHNKGTASFTVTVNASWSGVLQPINADGSSSFKLGSTIPVKFALTGASAPITNLDARLYYRKVSGVADVKENEAVSTAKSTEGNAFRYDPTSGQYIFNLATKSLSTGTYQLRLDFGDSVPRTVTIKLV